MRGVSVHLIEANEKQQNFLIKSLLPDETVTVPFVATGNPGEAKVDVSVTPVTRRDEQHATTTTPTTSPSRPRGPRE